MTPHSSGKHPHGCRDVSKGLPPVAQSQEEGDVVEAITATFGHPPTVTDTILTILPIDYRKCTCRMVLAAKEASYDGHPSADQLRNPAVERPFHAVMVGGFLRLDFRFPAGDQPRTVGHPVSSCTYGTVLKAGPAGLGRSPGHAQFKHWSFGGIECMKDS